MRVVASDAAMIDVEVLRRELAGIASVESAAMPDAAALIDAARGASGVVVDVGTPVPGEAIEALDLRVIGRAGTGVENVALETAWEHDVTVANVSGYCESEIATHALSLLLACVRRIEAYDRSVSAGEWDWTVGREGTAGGPIRRIEGRTVGLVSFGVLARRFRERLRGLDVDVIAYDPYTGAEEMAEHDVEKVDFDGLLDRSDHVSIHAPLTEETRGLFDAAAFARLPEHATVVNTGRGGIVEEDDLAAALDAGEVAAAGLDVMAEEPPVESPLFDREDVVLTPHAAWYSEEARRELNESIARDVRRALEGEEPEGAITPDADWLGR